MKNNPCGFQRVGEPRAGTTHYNSQEKIAKGYPIWITACTEKMNKHQLPMLLVGPCGSHCFSFPQTDGFESTKQPRPLPPPLPQPPPQSPQAPPPPPQQPPTAPKAPPPRPSPRPRLQLRHDLPGAGHALPGRHRQEGELRHKELPTSAQPASIRGPGFLRRKEKQKRRSPGPKPGKDSKRPRKNPGELNKATTNFSNTKPTKNHMTHKSETKERNTPTQNTVYCLPNKKADGNRELRRSLPQIWAHAVKSENKVP